MNIQRITEYFAERDWKYEIVNDDTVKMPLRCDNSSYNFYVRCIYDDDGNPNVLEIQVYVVEGMFKNIDPSKKMEVYELLNETIRGYYFCKLSIDQDNDIVLNYAFPINNNFIGKEDFFRIFDSICNIADEIFPKLMKLRWS